MKNFFRYNCILSITLLIVLFASCKKKAEKDPYADMKGNYFSIRQFALDEWNTFRGEPISIIMTLKHDGKTDSTYTNSDVMDWASVFKTFFATDISDRKFLGKYKFTQFDDNADETHNFFYQANDEELLTQKLLITIDQYTSKVKGIYIETHEADFWHDRTQKLYYKPMHTIQIQTDDKPMVGSNKYTILEYDFQR